ncbi:MAG: MBL fold metallo-hydrolase [Actinobacteria bacterium]|nr:MBL fold metallo-hydrolase [Actinomycetota bacterium]
MTMLEEIAQGLYLVRGANRGRFPWSHSVLAVGDRAILFDTGCGQDAVREVQSRFHVEVVINSHTHVDHFSGNHLFTGRELLVPRMFASILPDLEKLSIRFAGGGEPAREWLRLVRDFLGHHPVSPTGTFGEGEVFDLGGLCFQALHTPGHTLDHFCFWEEEKGILLSFDIDLTRFGPWYGHVECDLDQFRASIRRILSLNPRLVISSHRRPVRENVGEEIAAFEAVFERRDRLVLELLERGPATPEALAELSPIYGVRDSGFALARYFEARMIEKHLEGLEKRGLARRREDGSYQRT